MSIYSNTLSKFAFADAIASTQVKAMPEDNPRRQALVRMQLAARALLVEWPGGQFNPREIHKLHKRLKMFTEAVEWEFTPTHIQTMINFSLAQITDLIENHVTDPWRSVLLVHLGEAEQVVYELFSDPAFDREIPECIEDGISATRVWNEIIGG